MNLLVTYIVACADSVDDRGDSHSTKQRLVRATLWPITLTGWFVTQNSRLPRLLNILWTVLIAGWLLSLVADRL